MHVLFNYHIITREAFISHFQTVWHKLLGLFQLSRTDQYGMKTYGIDRITVR
jgi:hypothetical protein